MGRHRALEMIRQYESLLKTDIQITSGVDVSSYIEEAVTSTASKQRGNIKIMIRDAEGGSHGSRSQHAPTIKAGKGNTFVEIKLTRTNGKPNADYDKNKIDSKLARDMKTQILAGKEFANKNFDLLEKLWYCKSDVEGRKILAEIIENNPDYSFT